MRILIVEDDLTARRVLERFLAELGECELAMDGEEALELFHTAWAKNTPFELICLDLMIPKLDGYQVLGAIRDFERRRVESGESAINRARVIMTTSFNDSETFLRSVETGCEGFVPKPIDRACLFRTLNELGLL